MQRWRYILTLFIVLSFNAIFTAGAQEAGCRANDTCAEVAAATPEYGLPDEVIREYSVEFEQLTVNSRLLHDRRYVRVAGMINIHDAPNGNIVRTLDEGFNFFTVMNTEAGWTQIAPGQWVNNVHLTDANSGISQFTGIFLPEEPLEYAPAWMLINAYPSSEPGGPPRESNGLLYRYTQVNIFASVDVDGWRWYQIGHGKWVQQTGVAKVEPLERPESLDTERWVGIDLYEQVLIVYEGERAIFATLVATGLPRWPTFEGTYNIYFRRVRKDMSWGTPGDDFYYLQEVPWTMFFDEGRALHGAYWHDGLGYRRSHGCVNMSITDAHWLYNWIAEGMGSLNSPDVEVGPAVYIYSSDDYR
jgi:hypothetical protein